MQEREAAARKTDERREEEEGERVVVRDRRRVQLDDTGETNAKDAREQQQDAPSLKPTYVEELETRTRAAEQKVQDVQSRFEQMRAELKRETDELRARLTRTAEERAAREKASFVTALLPVVDNLRRALEAARDSGASAALLQGLQGTLSGFESALASSGVEAVEATGTPFNPEFHEAVDVAEVEPALDGEVIAEYERGYRMGNQLLRPARVQVGRRAVGAQGPAE